MSGSTPTDPGRGDAADGTGTAAPAAEAAAAAAPASGGRPVVPPRAEPTLLSRISQSSVTVTVLALVLGLVAGGILIAVTNSQVQATAGYFFARPTDFFAAVWQAVAGGYGALFQGSVYNINRPDFLSGIRPLMDTLTFATPLIAAALGVGLAFRVGLFNIGGRGQMLIAAAAAGWVGSTMNLPWGLHMILAVVAGLIGGAVWGGLVGFLKARTGAHEVILTIMLNYIAFYLLAFLLRTPGLLQAPDSSNPKSGPMADTAVFPKILGDRYNLHFGFILVILATIFVWWLLNRSALGFRFRAVGENPEASRVAGINVNNVYIYAMLLAGALAGLGGASQVLGSVTSGVTSGIDAGIGFDAITVALLGRSRPWGIFAAGVLFGALKAGSFSMQAAQGIPIDIVTVVQAVVVLMIAAPPLVRSIFFLNRPARRAAAASRLPEVSAK
ncbi:ABC transporter permease [Mycetocola reblochoni]|uniref:Ribose ABC transport system, permease protein RbsC (TC 3.A.1.2.1) n=2 Tax=Mycetocola reblochoni TaxID=331618 RepID=A0A1R4K041_9MICO|nr:ABC transporter permease [Mycetocola reblochoni]RLP70507.1 ABC transporter permease [Mycetocola reblochoni]SJN37524.1 Ribose ABC transport system, permease protein RbsC (TC 3.A.1.2.1) [Mycetocola reblochoni REB411]